MILKHTQQLVPKGGPIERLVHILASAIELVSLPENDFLWSSWEDADEAIEEISALIGIIEGGVIPPMEKIAVLFAPTGPLQEVSLNSGWGDQFLMIASQFDDVDKLLL